VSNEGGGATLHAPSSGRGCSAAWVGTGGDVGLSFATSALEVATDAGAEVSVVQQLPILDDQTPDEIFGAFESHLSSSWQQPCNPSSLEFVSRKKFGAAFGGYAVSV